LWALPSASPTPVALAIALSRRIASTGGHPLPACAALSLQISLLDSYLSFLIIDFTNRFQTVPLIKVSGMIRLLIRQKPVDKP
jgi:hypothetical protein